MVPYLQWAETGRISSELQMSNNCWYPIVFPIPIVDTNTLSVFPAFDSLCLFLYPDIRKFIPFAGDMPWAIFPFFTFLPLFKLSSRSYYVVLLFIST